MFVNNIEICVLCHSEHFADHNTATPLLRGSICDVYEDSVQKEGCRIFDLAVPVIFCLD